MHTVENLSSSRNDGNTMLAAAFSSELISKAREYATLQHLKTNHKYDGQPYDVHLQMVLRLIALITVEEVINGNFGDGYDHQFWECVKSELEVLS